jgi:hypothetical protein
MKRNISNPKPIVLAAAALVLLPLAAAADTQSPRLDIDGTPPICVGEFAGYPAIVDQVSPSVVKIITEVARKPVTSYDETLETKAAGKEEVLLLRVIGANGSRFVAGDIADA